MENNESQKTQTEEMAPVVNTQGRRSFLQKATAGALIATIPAKSVWATGLTNSIVASGHGSDFAGGMQMHLKDFHFWTTNISHVPDAKYTDIFGGRIIKNASKQTFDSQANRNKTLVEVLTELNVNNKLKFRGPQNINLELIAVYLNAKFSGMHGINFPVVGMTGKPYTSAEALAQGMYGTAMNMGGSPTLLAGELAMLNTNNFAML
ncbi:hypothetical protein [Glaciecola sp. SC05]|uniref:hypothetical protein n=1 Tax=Glaciecola sp. SC05 TaxID=1987355 RepID=UPI003528524D